MPELPEDTPRYDPAALRAAVAALFAAHGLGEADAACCAEALVRADLRGVWSHGVARVPMYCARLAAAAGHDELLAPGEPEARRESDNLARGVPLTDDVHQALTTLATRTGVPSSQLPVRSRADRPDGPPPTTAGGPPR